MKDPKSELNTGAVRVLGKGDKERRTYLVDGARRALEWWLSLRGTEAGPLLTRVLRGGHIRMRRLQPRAVAVVIERRIREAGLRDATAHDFRRTLTGDLLDAGADHRAGHPRARVADDDGALRPPSGAHAQEGARARTGTVFGDFRSA